MADWTPPDKYEGKLVLPGTPATSPVSPATVDDPSAFDRVAQVIERLYEREPKLTRDLLNELRAASTADLERLFGS
jgi:hypothetical protein